LDGGKRFGFPWRQGDGSTVGKFSEIKLANGCGCAWSMALAIDEKTATPANPFPTIMLKTDGSSSAADQLFIQLIEGL
jgi:hypothetical protein